MKKTDYERQIDLYKWGINEKQDKTTGKFTFTYNKTEYNLYGTYMYKQDVMRWDLYKENVDDRNNTIIRLSSPTSNIKTPITILKLMMKVERLVSKEWSELPDNIWHNEEV